MSTIPPVQPSLTVQTSTIVPAKPVPADASSTPLAADSAVISPQAQQLLAGDQDHDGDSH